MAKKLKFSKKKQAEILKFLQNRFNYLEKLRHPLDTEILEETDLYNDYDKNMQPYSSTTKLGKFWWEEKQSIPYIYTIVQTMVARMIQTFFGKQNYLKIYAEDQAYKDIRKDLEQWVQYELDKMKLKPRARDFIEKALVQRTAWIHLIPVINGKKMEEVDFNVYDWFDVWFDTKATRVQDTDFFIRDIVPLWQLEKNKDQYFNIDKIRGTVPPDEEWAKRQIYEVEHSKEKSVHYDPEKFNITDEVELMHWLGIYDISRTEEPDYQPVVYTWANRQVLIRTEQDDKRTDRKILMFPIRPIRQANSLIGKSVGQITKDLQYLLNECAALTIHNFKLLVKLLFKYNKNGDVDLDELWAGGGNAIGFEDNPKDVEIFDIPNQMENGLAMISWIIQLMQQATGAVDYLMGTSAARGVTETASGIKQITEQAMFKFQMMAENIYGDLLDFVNYIIILWARYNPNKVLEKFPTLDKFFNLTEEMLEDSKIIDIGLNDLTLRRDIERTNFLNGINIIAGLLQQVGGNTPKLLQEVMEKLEMENIDEILKGAMTPQQIQARMQQALLTAQAGAGAQGEGAARQKRGGSNKANPQAENAATPEEESSGGTPVTPEEAAGR